MTDPFKDFLIALRENPNFQAFVDKVLVPGIPNLRPYREGDTLEKWVELSSMREGYLLAMKKFGLELWSIDGRRTDPGSSSD